MRSQSSHGNAYFGTYRVRDNDGFLSGGRAQGRTSMTPREERRGGGQPLLRPPVEVAHRVDLLRNGRIRFDT